MSTGLSSKQFTNDYSFITTSVAGVCACRVPGVADHPRTTPAGTALLPRPTLRSIFHIRLQTLYAIRTFTPTPLSIKGLDSLNIEYRIPP